MTSFRQRNERRESTSVLLLLIVLLNLMKPLSPIISDVWGHSFNPEKHHLQLHAHGANHLHDQIEDVNSVPDDNSTANILSLTIDNAFVHFNEEFLFASYSISEIMNSGKLLLNYSFSISLAELQPPELI